MHALQAVWLVTWLVGPGQFEERATRMDSHEACVKGEIAEWRKQGKGVLCTCLTYTELSSNPLRPLP